MFGASTSIQEACNTRDECSYKRCDEQAGELRQSWHACSLAPNMVLLAPPDSKDGRWRAPKRCARRKKCASCEHRCTKWSAHCSLAAEVDRAVWVQKQSRTRSCRYSRGLCQNKGWNRTPYFVSSVVSRGKTVIGEYTGQ